MRSGRTAGQLAARQAVRAGRARLLAVPSRGPQLMRGRHAARAGCARGWTRCCGSAGRARRMCCAPRASWRSPAARSGTSCRRRAARAAAGRRGPWRGPCCVPACKTRPAHERPVQMRRSAQRCSRCRVLHCSSRTVLASLHLLVQRMRHAERCGLAERQVTGVHPQAQRLPYTKKDQGGEAAVRGSHWCVHACAGAGAV